MHENVQRVVLFIINTLDFVGCHSYDALRFALCGESSLMYEFVTHFVFIYVIRIFLTFALFNFYYCSWHLSLWLYRYNVFIPFYRSNAHLYIAARSVIVSIDYIFRINIKCTWINRNISLTINSANSTTTSWVDFCSFTNTMRNIWYYFIVWIVNISFLHVLMHHHIFPP